MADEQPHTEVDQSTGPPRWVKVTGVAVAAVVVLFVVLNLIGGGEGQQAPGRHSPGRVPTSTAVDQGALQ